MSASKEVLRATWDSKIHRRWLIALIIVVCLFVACTVIYDRLVRYGTEYEFAEFDSGKKLRVNYQIRFNLF